MYVLAQFHHRNCHCEFIRKEEKAVNGEGYLTSWCAGGRGNTTHTPEARGVKLQSPYSLGKIWDIQ